jgi:hypothetical protein
MEPLDGLSSLSELVRLKLQKGTSTATRKDGATTATPNPKAQHLALAELERQLRLKLKELGPGAARGASARRSIIASLLICELDARLHNESRFNALVRSIQKSIDEDERLRTRFDALIEQLSR